MIELLMTIFKTNLFNSLSLKDNAKLKRNFFSELFSKSDMTYVMQEEENTRQVKSFIRAVKLFECVKRRKLFYSLTFLLGQNK